MKTNKGFHYSIIIIIVLVIAVLGLVGYIFWNTWLNPNKSNTNTNTNVNTASNTNQTVSKGCGADIKFTANSGLGYNFSFSYPCDWTKDEQYTANDANTDQPRDKITVTSPTNKTTVKYDIGYLGGLGGMCDEADASITSVGAMQSYTSNAIAGIKDGFLVDYIYTNNGTVAKAKTYISNKESFNIGGNYCQQFLTEILSLNPKTEKDSGGRWSGIWSTMVVLSDIQNSDGSVKANLKVADVQAARASSEYTQAKSILQSSTYSKL